MTVHVEGSGKKSKNWNENLVYSCITQESDKSSPSKLAISTSSFTCQLGQLQQGIHCLCLNQDIKLNKTSKRINRNNMMDSNDPGISSGDDFPDNNPSNGIVQVDCRVSPTNSRIHLEHESFGKSIVANGSDGGEAERSGNLDPDSKEQDYADAFKSNNGRQRVEGKGKKMPSISDAAIKQNKSNMFSEAERLASFRDWPFSAPVRPAELARAGLFFVEKPDTVECFKCGSQLREWVHGDSAMGEHHKLCPECPFVNGLETGNVPLTPIKDSFGAHEETLLEEKAKSKTESLFSALETPGEPNLTSVEESGGKDHQFTYNEDEDPLVREATRTFKNEYKRLMSFIYWPTNNGIQPGDLAKAGFYYCGSEDRVQCFTCFGILRNWEMGDEPMEEHRKHFPNCPFVRGDEVGNIPLKENSPGVAEAAKYREKAQKSLKTHGAGDPDPPPATAAAAAASVSTYNLPYAMALNQTAKPTSHSNPQNPYQYPVLNKARHSEYADEDRRMQTFTTENQWPIEAMISAAELVQAGFYYIGVADNVKCFYCDGGLRNWELGDEPWREHARWFPKCEFVVRKKGADWVEAIRRQHPLPGLDDEFEEQGLGSLGSSYSGGNASHHDPSFSSHHSSIPSHHSVNVGYLLDTPMVQMVLEMGYRQDSVKQALERRMRSTGDNFPNTEDLLQAVWEIEDDLNKSAAAASAEPGEKTGQLTETSVTGGEGGGETAPPPVGSLNSQPPDHALTSSGGDPTHGAFSAPPNIGTAAAASGSSTVPEIEKQLETLKDRVMCKVCMDNDACMLFLPCKHVVTCEDCAGSLRKCPVCRSRIKTSTKIFF